MEYLLNDLRDSLKHKLFYSSLFLALSIPDICGALESEDGNASKKSYIRWYESVDKLHLYI